MQATMRLIIDPPQDGAWNMAVDEALMHSVGEVSEGNLPTPVLRFYQWHEPTLSLGYFQHHAQRSEHSASAEIPMVRRNSGGGAIVHDQELTYSLTVPESGISTFPGVTRPADLYSVLHETLIESLLQLNVESEMVDQLDSGLEGEFLCFKRRAPNDVLVGGNKVCGSAQRRKFGAISQHGSVILATSTNAPEITGINDLTGQNVHNSSLIERWKIGISDRLDTQFKPSRLTETENKLAQDTREVKFSAVTWNCKR